MMGTGIEYLDEVWNCITGCKHVSRACTNCWARRMTNRLQKMGEKGFPAGKKYIHGFDTVVCHDDELTKPLKWKSGKVVGVNFMSDTFQLGVPDDFLKRMFVVMSKAKRHTFVMLTKRAEWLPGSEEILDWGENIWMGVTVESGIHKGRIDDLRESAAVHKWVSWEPLLRHVGELDLTGIHWGVVGCESGPGARPMKEEWAREIIEQCEAAGVPVFYKQAMIDGKLMSMPKLDGKQYAEIPFRLNKDIERILPEVGSPAVE